MTADLSLAHDAQNIVVAEARRWLGTPYRHQASLRGVGCDCLGLLRGVWRAAIGREPEAPPAYTPDWSEPGCDERLLAAARRHLAPAETGAPAPGDVLVFRMRRSAPAKHLGIVSAGGRMIHAHSRHGVVETALDRAWLRRLAARFRFPVCVAKRG